MKNTEAFKQFIKNFNFESIEWSQLEDFLNDHLYELREMNDDQALNDSETKDIRAEIKVVKKLLQLRSLSEISGNPIPTVKYVE